MLKPAAVILLHETSTDSLILTKRTDFLKDHPGEYCFPGGRQEPIDKNLQITALRELHEELGIEASRVSFVFKMAPERTLRQVMIHPWFATIDTLKPFDINPKEVSRILSLPMKEVTYQRNYQTISIYRDGKYYESCHYIACKEYVWGATAKIMKQLCIPNQLQEA